MSNVFNEDDDFLGTVEPWLGGRYFRAYGYPNAGPGVDLGFFRSEIEAEYAVRMWHDES